MFHNQNKLDQGSLVGEAQAIGINGTDFAACLDSPGVQDSIQKSLLLASRIGVTSTPTFMLGLRQPDGRVAVTSRVAGMQSMPKFEETVDALLHSVPHSATSPGSAAK
jgi:predicted DsbA family dithiol-disulfide isomerase